MALLKEESYTIEDIYALPDGERAELIDGHIYYMAPPSYKHQKLVMELSAIIRNYIKQHKGTCEVLPAPFAVYLDEINNTYVEPDISVICDPNKLDDKGCKGAPDWIIEIVSPESRKMDYLLKTFQISFRRCPGILDRRYRKKTELQYTTLIMIIPLKNIRSLIL